MVATVISIVIIAILAFFGVKRIVGSAKGKGCCSGGGGGELKPKKKKLEGEIIAKKEVGIEGMSCINCQYKVERSINDIPGAAAHVDHKKNKARVEMDRDVADEEIINAVEKYGYKVTEIHAL
jgi:copper chaperone CopZ